MPTIKSLPTLACILTCMVAPSAGLGMPQTAVRISYSFAASHLSLGEPVVMDFEIRNDFDRTVIALLGNNGHNLQFLLTRPDGTRIQLRPPQKEGFTDGGGVLAEAGQSGRRELLLNDWFSFELPGEYQIAVSLATPVTDLHGQTISTKTEEKLTLSIGPRDESRLRTLCQSLLERISSAGNHNDAERAANLLSAIRDPVAVPYLLQATAFWDLNPITIKGLEKIGDSPAVEALVSIFRLSDGERTLLARNALMSIENRSTETKLKASIRQALESTPNQK